MYRLIVVDDEQYIRDGLKRIMPWEDFGIEIVGSAADGEAALALVKETKPDLMLLDIEMPRLNGLGMLEKLKDQKDAPLTIVLSGYDSFEYVRTSMKLGAVNYLLKPIDVDDLKASVSEAISTVNDIAMRKMQFSQTMQALKNNTLNRLLGGKITLKELREKCKLLGITLRANHMQVGVVKPQFDRDDVSLRHIVFSALEACEAVLQKEELTGYCVADADDNIAVIFIDKICLPEKGSLCKTLDACRKEILQKAGVSSVAALGSPASIYCDLPLSYKHALNLLSYRLIWGSDETPPADHNRGAPPLDEEHLAADIAKMDKEALHNDVHAFFRQLHTLPRGHADTVKYHVVEYLLCAVRAASRTPGSSQALRQLQLRAYRAIHDAIDSFALEKAMCSTMDELLDLILSNYNANFSSKVRLVLKRMRAHYDDPNLSIKTLAAEMNVSAAVLGRQFRQETSQFFTDYLTDLRISAAKDLLEHTPMKVTEVAEAVGFSSIGYFHAVFKKTVGCAPGYFRNNESTI